MCSLTCRGLYYCHLKTKVIKVFQMELDSIGKYHLKSNRDEYCQKLFLELSFLIFKTQGWSTVTTLADSKHPSIIHHYTSNMLLVTMTTQSLYLHHCDCHGQRYFSLRCWCTLLLENQRLSSLISSADANSISMFSLGWLLKIELEYDQQTAPQNF